MVVVLMGETVEVVSGLGDRRLRGRVVVVADAVVVVAVRRLRAQHRAKSMRRLQWQGELVAVRRLRGWVVVGGAVVVVSRLRDLRLRSWVVVGGAVEVVARLRERRLRERRLRVRRLRAWVVVGGAVVVVARLPVTTATAVYETGPRLSTSHRLAPRRNLT